MFSFCKSKHEIKNISSNIAKAYKETYITNFFTEIETRVNTQQGGKCALYHTLKRNYKRESYLELESNKLRRNITQIRISCHNLPIEYLRKLNISRENRKCILCRSQEIGSEEHVLIYCENKDIVQHRKTLLDKITTVNYDFVKLNTYDKFIYLLLAIDNEVNFYFAIFLDKVYCLVDRVRKELNKKPK